MNAQASTSKAPALDEIAASAFNTKVKEVVNGVGNGEKALVSLLTVAVSRWYGVDKGGCDVIANFTNAIAPFPIKQKAAVKVMAKILPHVVVTLDDEGKATAENKKRLSDLDDTAKKEGLTLIEAFKSMAYGSIEKAAKGDMKPKEKTFKPITNAQVTTKAQKVAIDLLAQIMLSFDGISEYDAKDKLRAAIDSISDSEISAAKQAIQTKFNMIKPEAESEKQAA